MTVTQVTGNCNRLRGKWATRNQSMKDSYDLITLENPLKQEGMESVIGNDPRTGFNLGLHLLTSGIISHKIESEDFMPEEVAAAAELEKFITKYGWTRLESKYRRDGRQSWVRDLVALLLARGWYSVFAAPTETELEAEVWEGWRPEGLELDEAKVEELIEARNAARAAKDFAESDRIRDELAGMGIAIKDGPDGTKWELVT